MDAVTAAFALLLDYFSGNKQILSKVSGAKEIWQRTISSRASIAGNGHVRPKARPQSVLRHPNVAELDRTLIVVQTAAFWKTCSILDFVTQPLQEQPGWILRELEQPSTRICRLRTYVVLRALHLYFESRATTTGVSIQDFTRGFLKQTDLDDGQRRYFQKQMRRGARLAHLQINAFPLLIGEWVREVSEDHLEETTELASTIEVTLGNFDEEGRQFLNDIGGHLLRKQTSFQDALRNSWASCQVIVLDATSQDATRKRRRGKSIPSNRASKRSRRLSQCSTNAATRPNRSPSEAEQEAASASASIDSSCRDIRYVHPRQIDRSQAEAMASIPEPGDQAAATDNAINDSEIHGDTLQTQRSAHIMEQARPNGNSSGAILAGLMDWSPNRLPTAAVPSVRQPTESSQGVQMNFQRDPQSMQLEAIAPAAGDRETYRASQAYTEDMHDARHSQTGLPDIENGSRPSDSMIHPWEHARNSINPEARLITTSNFPISDLRHTISHDLVASQQGPFGGQKEGQVSSRQITNIASAESASQSFGLRNEYHDGNSQSESGQTTFDRLFETQTDLCQSFTSSYPPSLQQRQFQPNVNGTFPPSLQQPQFQPNIIGAFPPQPQFQPNLLGAFPPPLLQPQFQPNLIGDFPPPPHDTFGAPPSLLSSYM